MKKRGNENTMGSMVLVALIFIIFLAVIWPKTQGTILDAKNKQICQMSKALSSGAQCVANEIILEGDQDESNEAIAELIYMGIKEAKKKGLDHLNLMDKLTDKLVPNAWQDPRCWTLATIKFEGEGKTSYKDPLSLYTWMDKHMVRLSNNPASYSTYVRDAVVTDKIMVDINYRQRDEVGEINPEKEYRIMVRRMSSGMKDEYKEFIDEGSFSYDNIPVTEGISPARIRMLLEKGKPKYQVIIFSDDVFLECKKRIGD